MKQKFIHRICSPIATALVLVAASVASTATWFMFYQPHEPSYLRKNN